MDLEIRREACRATSADDGFLLSFQPRPPIAADMSSGDSPAETGATVAGTLTRAHPADPSTLSETRDAAPADVDSATRVSFGLCLVLAVAELVWFARGLSGHPEPAVIGWLAAPITMALATAALFRTARIRHLHAAARRFWSQLGIGAAALVVSVAVQAGGALAQPGHVALPTVLPRFCVAGYLVAVLAPLWALVRLPGAVKTRQDRVRLALDTSTVAVGGGLFVYYFVFGESSRQAGGSGFWGLFAVGLLAMAALATVTKLLLGGADPIPPAALRAFAGCMLIGGLSPAILAITASHPQLAPPQLTDPFIAVLVIRACRRQQRSAGRVREGTGRRTRPLTWLPYLAVAATDVLLVVGIFQPDDDRRTVAVVCAVVVTALVVTRQFAAMRENAALVDALHDQREMLRHRVTHDALTHLANRDLFRERTEHELAAAAQSSVAVLLIDLDDFKAVNDTLGHSVGDQLLIAVAARLRECVRPSDTVARLGGDEFAILVADVGLEHISAIVDRVLASFARPIVVEPHALVVHASVGVAIAEEGDHTGELLRNADIAMYAAKENGKSGHAHYSADMHAKLLQGAELAAQLRVAIDSGQLRVLYQPAIDLADGQLMAVEALVRWQHPTRGLLTPAEFIPAAEQTGLIIPLGRWVATEACRQLAEWRRALGAPTPRAVSVNVAAAQLKQPDYADELLGIIGREGLLPSDVIVEVTETAVFDGDAVFETLRALRDAGVRIALDDFGTGQSSLSLLRECPAEFVKLDKSFVDHVSETDEYAVIAEAVVHIAQVLGLIAVAEGIETQVQAVRLRNMGYRFAQGYLFARPLWPAQVSALLCTQLQLGVRA